MKNIKSIDLDFKYFFYVDNKERGQRGGGDWNGPVGSACVGKVFRGVGPNPDGTSFESTSFVFLVCF